jgi:hypothetical protein
MSYVAILGIGYEEATPSAVMGGTASSDFTSADNTAGGVIL